jgi:hypothetical protein
MPFVLLILALVAICISFAYGYSLGSVDKMHRLAEMPPPNADMAYRRTNAMKN